MAEPIVVDNGTLTDYSVLVDDVIDATLGTGAKQLVGLVDGTIGSTTKIASGGGVEAGALRVTLASDSTGLVSVDDNGGSLTVDGPVTDTQLRATAVPVSLASVPSHAVTNAGTFATQADTELTTADLDTGVGTDTRAVVGIALAASGGATIISAANPLPVTGTITAVTALTNALPAGDNNIGNVDIVTVPAPLNVVGTGTEAAALRVTIATDSTGLVSVDDNGGSLTVDGAVTVTNATAANLKAEVVGTGTFAVQAALTAGTNTNEVVGDAAHDAAIAGNPLRLAGRALTADYTAVAAGDTADLITSVLGKQVILPYALPGAAWKYAAASGGIVNTTAITIKAAGAAGVVNYLTHLSVINGHATVSTEVAIRDGAAGTVIWRGWAQAAGGGVADTFVPPIPSTAATLLEVVCITTGAAVYVNAQGYSGAE